tara:strand:+ start:5655 stop:7514 length:1860 start_codon:yes stop_codon:yes gene_type:complete
MYVIGTAGHVDHGKSTLIEALTGIDPDRLDEEKRRGMTIDLGFAWMELPSGREVSIVDVPGHEKFIRNMLAGVGNIDLALLIVAADESVMPQTREHIGILNLLGISKAIIVITKSDTVDQDLLSIVELEISETLTDTPLSKSPIRIVSSTKKWGLNELKNTIDDLLSESENHTDKNQPRLPIDRVFSISGFGTVVTGTLIDGQFAIGQSIEVQPQAINGRIRGIQSHEKKVELIGPGNRVALNLGGINASEITRGSVVMLPGWARSTSAIDTNLKLLNDAPHSIRHNFPVSFHSNTSETQAKIRLLDTNEISPGSSAWAQITLNQKLHLLEGDRFIIRSADTTIGGGTVIKIDAKRHRRNSPSVITALKNIESDQPISNIYRELESFEPVFLNDLSKKLNISASEIRGIVLNSYSSVEPLICIDAQDNSNSLIYKSSNWSKLELQGEKEIEDFHRANPLKSGMPKEEMKGKLNLSNPISSIVLANLTQVGIYQNEAGLLVSSSHKISLTESQIIEIENYFNALQKDPFMLEPPSIELSLQALLISEGRLIRSTQGICFTQDNYENLKTKISNYIKDHGSITVAEARDLFSTSRKYALAILECLDAQKITRRNGDARILL